MFSEIKVTIKDDEKSLTKKFPHYECYNVSEDDETIKSDIEETLKNFSGTPDSVRVTIVLEMQ